MEGGGGSLPCLILYAISDTDPMCSEPITSLNKETGEEITFACRTCDDCLAARKGDWVARAMAETATSAHTFVITLTYRNGHNEKPLGARAFRYRDVQLYLKALRASALRKYGDGVEIRYIVAGERGSQKNRVHWHMILWASHDLRKLGKWFDFWMAPIVGPRPTRMDHWTLWPHGHVVTDVADQQTMAYILKYCLKDMFNIEKSRDTKRHHKAENHGASMFRMSKKPPIGLRFLEGKIERLRELCAVPPRTEIAIPGYSGGKGYWWPRGLMREVWLTALREINKTHRERFGRNCPQWSTLLASVEQNEKDLEVLNGLEEEAAESPKEFEEELRAKQRLATLNFAVERRRAECGRIGICAQCFNSLGDDERQEFLDWKALQYQQAEDCGFVKRDADKWFRQQNRPNPFCFYREEREKDFRFPPA